MENSCLKKYKPSPKNWVLASRRTGFRRNSALIPANAGLFHYAGNNPVRYIDPIGAYTVDEEKRSIEANLLDKNDMEGAIRYYKRHQNFTLTATNSDGDGIIFKNYNDAKTYQNMGNKKENKRNIDITDIISMIGNSSFIVSKSGKDIKKLERISKNLGRLSSYASYLSTGIDLYKEINEPNVSNTIDLLIDAIGYIPGCGPYISISLSESKKALIYSSTELAKYKEYKESLLLNMISDFYFGIRIK